MFLSAAGGSSLRTTSPHKSYNTLYFLQSVKSVNRWPQRWRYESHHKNCDCNVIFWSFIFAVSAAILHLRCFQCSTIIDCSPLTEAYVEAFTGPPLQLVFVSLLIGPKMDTLRGDCLFVASWYMVTVGFFVSFAGPSRPWPICPKRLFLFNQNVITQVVEIFIREGEPTKKICTKITVIRWYSFRSPLQYLRSEHGSVFNFFAFVSEERIHTESHFTYYSNYADYYSLEVFRFKSQHLIFRLLLICSTISSIS